MHSFFSSECFVRLFCGKNTILKKNGVKVWLLLHPSLWCIQLRKPHQSPFHHFLFWGPKPCEVTGQACRWLKVSRAKDSKTCFNSKRSTKTRCVIGNVPDPSLNETLWLTYSSQQFIEASGHHWFSETKSTDQHLFPSSSHSLEAWVLNGLDFKILRSLSSALLIKQTSVDWKTSTICRLFSFSPMDSWCLSISRIGCPLSVAVPWVPWVPWARRPWVPGCPAVPRHPNEPRSFPPPAVQHPEPFEWPAMAEFPSKMMAEMKTEGFFRAERDGQSKCDGHHSVQSHRYLPIGMPP